MRRADHLVFQVFLSFKKVHQPFPGIVGHGVDGKVPTLQIFLQAGRKGYFFRVTAIFILAIHPVGGNLESLFFKQHCYGSVSDSCIYGSVKQGFDLLRLG